MPHSRRDLFKRGFKFGLGGVLGSTVLSAGCAPSADDQPEGEAQLSLMDFQPRSMLITEEHPVLRARYPIIDMHTHVVSVFRRTPEPGAPLQGTAAERLDQIVRWMDEPASRRHRALRLRS